MGGRLLSLDDRETYEKHLATDNPPNKLSRTCVLPQPENVHDYPLKELRHGGY